MNPNKVHLITEEIYEHIKDRKYTSGGDIKIGDKVIMGLIYDSKDNYVLNIIKIHPEEIGVLYELDEKYSLSEGMLNVYKEIK